MTVARYLITYDISGTSNSLRYQNARNAILHAANAAHNEGKISSFISLSSLSSTYLIQSVLNTNQLKELFKKSTNESIRLIVVKYSDRAWRLDSNESRWLSDENY